jgi:mRNA deadenylase 3'-5' endonuclease subunit Ccr4
MAESRTGSTTVAIAQFNLLASHLALSKHFPYTLPHLLQWSNRRELLLREMKELNADIVCCQVCFGSLSAFAHTHQEVTHFLDFFQVSQ